ncbi:class I glutamine amidotransferase-like protein [Schizophyllum commune Tattone D]|nr:class I glutamine amidotransferase-like protein [Schizophyllum commune Tattone D]
MASKILIVFTSCDKLPNGAEAGWYLPEAAHPYYALSPSFTVDFASPKGANPPVSQGSVELFKEDAESVEFLADDTVKQKLASAKRLSEVNPDDYAAVFYVGGHGPCIDLPDDETNIKLANAFWRAGKIVSAVCHGPAALVKITDASGQSIFKGRCATCFTVAEEKILGTVDAIPFQPEETLKELGAQFENAGPFESRVVVDGQLLTGQNPASSRALAEEVLKALKG